MRGLNHTTLRQLQRVLREINLYINAFKICLDYFQDHSPGTIEQLLIHQVDPTCRQRGTHNLPAVSKKVATVIIGVDEVPVNGHSLERDIVIETHSGAL